MEKVILFGMGKYFRTKANLIEKYEVVKILDNKAVVGSNYQNIEITKPIYVGEGNEKILLMSMYFVSMWKQLIEIGVNPKRIVYPYFEKPYFQSDVVVDECVKSIEFGKEAINITCKNGEAYSVKNQDEWNEVLRDIYRSRFSIIGAISEMTDIPISEQFATERGTPVDRYYIEDFLKDNSRYIEGDVLEIEDNKYTLKYGGVKVKKSLVMDYDSQTSGVDFNADLESGIGIRAEVADCFICTQTLMYIFDLKAVARNIIKLLKINGVALITCSGLSQNSRRCMESYGAYWGFNEAVFKKMFEDINGAEIVSTGTYGNIKTVTAHINGLCAEDLAREDFMKTDICYPLIVYAVVRKNE